MMGVLLTQGAVGLGAAVAYPAGIFSLMYVLFFQAGICISSSFAGDGYLARHRGVAFQ